MRPLGLLVLGLALCAGPPATAQACTPVEAERRSWVAASRENDPALYVAHLRRFPGGCLRDDAVAKLESLVEVSPVLTVQASMAYDYTSSGGNGDVVGRKDSYLVQFRLTSPSIPLDFMCDSLMHGRAEAVQWEKFCPRATAPFQRLGVRIPVALHDLYSLEVSCGTIELPTHARRTYQADESGWCGPSRSDWNYSSMAIQWLSVTVRRKDLRTLAARLSPAR